MMLDAARAQADPAALRAMQRRSGRAAAAVSRPHAGRAYRRAIESAVDRLIRDREQLPTVFFD